MGRATSTARQSHLFRDHIMLTIRQSPFDLFERLEQQLATAERVPNAEILDNKATDRNLVISAERPQPNQSDDSEPLLSEFRSGIWSRSFRFPHSLNRDALKATYRDGILEITATKAVEHTSVSVSVEN